MDKRIYECRQWIADLDKIVDSLPFFDALSGRSMPIASSTGLIGSAAKCLLL